MVGGGSRGEGRVGRGEGRAQLWCEVCVCAIDSVSDAQKRHDFISDPNCTLHTGINRVVPVLGGLRVSCDFTCSMCKSALQYCNHVVDSSSCCTSERLLFAGRRSAVLFLQAKQSGLSP